MRLFNFKPVLMRFGYDTLAVLYASIMTVLLLASSHELSIYLKFILINPISYLVLNTLLGIYGRNKFSSVKTKSFYFIISSTIVLILDYIFNLLLWGGVFIAIATPLFISARFFLNFNSRFNRRSIRLVSGAHKILVVGGAGYIGTHVIRELLHNGYYVRILDSFMFGREAIDEFVGHKNFSYIDGDATNVLSLANAMQGIDGVIHLAGLVGDPACAVDSEFTLHTNLVSARLVKDISISAGVKRFIFASSCSVYGVNDDVVDERSDLNPVSLYAKTKIATEEELLKLSRDDFHVTILRFATVFGHSNRQRFDLVGNLFAAQAFNSQELTVIGADQWRPFVHVRDLARSVRYVLDASADKISGEIFNVGDDSFNRTIQGLAEELKSAYESIFDRDLSIKIVDMAATDKRNYRVSFGKIYKTLKFKCETNFHNGFCELLENFRKGIYGDYRDAKYSNVQITRNRLVDFTSTLKNKELYTALEFSLGDDWEG